MNMHEWNKMQSSINFTKCFVSACLKTFYRIDNRKLITVLTHANQEVKSLNCAKRSPEKMITRQILSTIKNDFK